MEKVDKIVEVVEARITRVTVPTSHRESLNDFLVQRRVEQVTPCKTDIWNNIESAYTIFEVATSRAAANELLEIWVSGLS